MGSIAVAKISKKRTCIVPCCIGKNEQHGVGFLWVVNKQNWKTGEPSK